MSPTPFEHGLALAWSDGALSREGALMLEALQTQLGLSDKERAVQEQEWLNEISKNERRSFGDGDQILREWLEGLSDKENLGQSARSMGKAALDVGLSKTAWRDAFTFAKGLGLGEELANGVWLEGEAEPLDGWPAALDPLAIILGLVLSVPKSIQKKDAELSEGDAFVVIDHQDAKPTYLSWMPELTPVKHDKCGWGWEGDHSISTPAPKKDMVFCSSVLLAWIRRFISMRHKRGEKGLDGIPDGFQIMPSSSELESDGNNLKISMIVDLGESGLVRPFATVNVDGVAKLNPAPEGLGESWVRIHDAVGNLVLNALETLPLQLSQAAGLHINFKNVSLEDGWITLDFDE